MPAKSDASGLDRNSRRLPWLPNLLLIWFGFVGTLGFIYNLKNASSYLSSWTIGDWLISYAGGFVRRGLPGQFLYSLAKASHLSPIYFIWGWCCIAFVLLAVLLWRFASARLDPVLLASPFCLLMPLLGDYFFRKDITIVLLYGLCLLIISRCSRAPGLLREFGCIIGVNSLGVLAVLTHESFLFFGLPSLIWLSPRCFRAFSGHVLRGVPSVMCGLIYLLPICFASAAVLIFKGSGQHALLIHHAWQEVADLFATQSGLLASHPPDGAINALGWSMNAQPVFVISQLVLPISYAFGQLPPLNPPIPAVLPWLITVYVVVLLFCAAGQSAFRELRIRVIAFQLCCVAPLFLIGVDYGRWIFLLTTSSALLYGFLPSFYFFKCLKGRCLSFPLFVHANALIPSALRQGSVVLMALLLLGIPACCWSIRGFGLASPIGYPYKFFVICLSKGNCAG